MNLRLSVKPMPKDQPLYAFFHASVVAWIVTLSSMWFVAGVVGTCGQSRT